MLTEKEAINKLKQMGSVREYTDGAIVCLEGDPGNEVFIIVRGKAEVSKKSNGKRVVLDKISENELFGELSAFGDSNRSATVKAIGKIRVRCIDKSDLENLLINDPSIALYFLSTISKRLYKLDSEIFKYCGEDDLEFKKVDRFYSSFRGKNRLQ